MIVSYHNRCSLFWECFWTATVNFTLQVFSERSGALTNNQKLRIERIQKRALWIVPVFGTSYTTYEQVLSHCMLQSLEERRQLLCSSFMESTFNKTTQFRQYLPAPQNTRTLRRTVKIPEFLCKTDRMRNSALPYLVRNFNISWIYLSHTDSWQYPLVFTVIYM